MFTCLRQTEVIKLLRNLQNALSRQPETADGTEDVHAQMNDEESSEVGVDEVEKDSVPKEGKRTLSTPKRLARLRRQGSFGRSFRIATRGRLSYVEH